MMPTRSFFTLTYEPAKAGPHDPEPIFGKRRRTHIRKTTPNPHSENDPEPTFGKRPRTHIRKTTPTHIRKTWGPALAGSGVRPPRPCIVGAAFRRPEY